MTRRVVAALVSVVLAALMAGCSNDSDPGTISASASSGAPPTPSVAAVTTTSSTSTAPPSGVDSSEQATLNPWPASLTPAQAAHAKDALDVYGRYQALVLK